MSLVSQSSVYTSRSLRWKDNKPELLRPNNTYLACPFQVESWAWQPKRRFEFQPFKINRVFPFLDWINSGPNEGLSFHSS